MYVIKKKKFKEIETLKNGLTIFWNVIVVEGYKSVSLSYSNTVYQRGSLKISFFPQVDTNSTMSLYCRRKLPSSVSQVKAVKPQSYFQRNASHFFPKLCLTECFHWNCWQRHGVYHLWWWRCSTIPRRSWGETTEKGVWFGYKSTGFVLKDDVLWYMTYHIYVYDI